MFEWLQLFFGFWWHLPSRIGPLDSSHAFDVARLHGEGGFSRGWDSGECAALLAEARIFADGAFSGYSDRLVGFILVRKVKDEAEVLSIVISPDYRQHGLGKALLSASIGRLARHGTRQIFLEVAAGNAPAIALYTSQGFREVGRRTAYYPLPGGGKADALVMRYDFE